MEVINRRGKPEQEPSPGVCEDYNIEGSGVHLKSLQECEEELKTLVDVRLLKARVRAVSPILFKDRDWSYRSRGWRSCQESIGWLLRKLNLSRCIRAGLFWLDGDHPTIS